jgi:hypothetical protein
MLDDLAAMCHPAAVHDRVPEIDALAPLLAAAERHDVTGLVVAALLKQESAGLPPDLHEGLAIYRDGMRIEARRAENQLAELLGRLAERGLPAMPFKGPVLAHRAYSDPTLRAYLDLDLMVHPDDVVHVVACLVEAGYVHQRGLGRDGVALLRRYAGEYIMYPADGLPVEPHWHPAPFTMAFDIDIEALWRRAQATDFLGAPCYLPTPEDHLLLLALHGAKEEWHRLKWLIDVAALLAAHPALDLAGLRGEAAAQGCRRVLDLALLLSHRLFAVPHAAPPPDRAVARRADDVLARLARLAERRAGPYAVTRFHWGLRERRRDRWRYAARTLLTPRVVHYNRLPLPRALRWLHVPLKLPWDYGVTPALRLARRATSVYPPK